MNTSSPLFHPDAEQAVLGAIFIDNAVLAQIRPLLPDHTSFTDPLCSQAYRAILRLSDQGKPVDHITIQTEMPGHEAALAELLDAAVTTANAVHHAGMLAEATLRRRTVGLAERLVARCKDPDLKLGDTLAGMVGELAKLGTESGTTKPKSFASTLMDVVEQIGKPPEHGTTRGIPTGLRKLDDMLDGFYPGLHIIAGNPTEGKSSLARWVARRAAEEGPVWINSLEMGQEQIAGCLFQSEIGYTTRWLGESENRLENFWPKIAAAQATLSALPITIAEGLYTPSAVRLAWQAECAQGRTPKLVIIDYLQLMRADGRHDRRDLEIGAITGPLKQWSLREKLPIILLSQFSRENKKTGRKPRLDDLRESGNIEQDADSVTAIHLPHGMAETGSWIVDLLVLKNRSGPIGRAQVSFEPWTYRYSEPVTS